uniref:Uncharacterized protein n=1 Tax=Caenorhabditis tropicalis TaxID=1561998 RepID=A0A1I7T8P1_9PELO
MDEKDDFDVFIEKAEKVIKLYEAGHNVNQETIELQKQALLLDPSTIPSTNIHPLLISKIVAEETNSKKTFDTNFRQRKNILKLHLDNNNPLKQPVKKTNTTFLQRIFIFIILFTSSCFIYYLRMPSPCPRPVW